MAGRAALIVMAVLLAGSCGAAPTGPSPTGQWGGDHIALTVTASGSHAELDCAHGDITEPIESSTFRLAGTFVREHGGPIAIGESPDTHPAIYLGTVVGDAMTLTIRVTDTNEAIGSYTLTRGATGHIVKCL